MAGYCSGRIGTLASSFQLATHKVPPAAARTPGQGETLLDIEPERLVCRPGCAD
jgi:hypothetical protein